MSERIIAQIDRFAPGFRDRILAYTSHTALDIEHRTLNCIGGDLNSGLQDWRQLYTRPMARIDPYATPAHDIFLCSSSTPPGSGVHGMCGYYAARSALRRLMPA
jgi:phytoene dehydrogenase-like protein